MSTDPDEQALNSYLALLRDRPDLFANHPSGGIEILTDPQEIAQARAAALSHRRAAGLAFQTLAPVCSRRTRI